MANQTFTVNLPDEPYKATTELGLSFECTYTGPRYVLMQIDKMTFNAEKPDVATKLMIEVLMNHILNKTTIFIV